MTDIRTLSARVSEATGPSRELDAEIWLALDPRNTRKQWSYVHEAAGRTCEIDETRNSAGRLITVPEYTASLDAVTALIAEKLPDWIWRVYSPVSERVRATGALAKVDRNHDAFCGPVTHVEASTPALALLSATLLAIHERNKSDDRR